MDIKGKRFLHPTAFSDASIEKKEFTSFLKGRKKTIVFSIQFFSQAKLELNYMYKLFHIHEVNHFLDMK